MKFTNNKNTTKRSPFKHRIMNYIKIKKYELYVLLTESGSGESVELLRKYLNLI